MVAVLPSWRRTPSTSRVSATSLTSPSSSGVTSHGPVGLNVGADLPLTHWPPRSICHSRSLTSLTSTYPAIASAASCSSRRYEQRRPTTMPSSTSQSVLPEPRGITTSSSGPTTVLGDFVKRMASVGRPGRLGGVIGVVQADAQHLVRSRDGTTQPASRQRLDRSGAHAFADQVRQLCKAARAEEVLVVVVDRIVDGHHSFLDAGHVHHHARHLAPGIADPHQPHGPPSRHIIDNAC